MLSGNRFRYIVCASALVLSIVLSTVPSTVLVAQVRPESEAVPGTPALSESEAVPVAVVRTGIEILRERNFKCLEGLRVGLVTNPSGVDRNLRSTVDILHSAPNVNLVALFAPEHGIRGDIYAGGKVESGRDESTGLPVFSLYGATRQPTNDMLKGVDVIVYDIQDVGSRSYTFISTLGLVMRSCAEAGIPVIVLDRPNPLGGIKTEGPLVEDGFHSFVGQYKIPYLYGLTVGELAGLINEEGLNCGQDGRQQHLKCSLSVIPMEGWQRSMLYADTGLPWVPPSPNIPYPENAVCYPSAGICGELSNYLNIGIGYTLPFGTFAEEWIDADALKARLDSYGIPGIAWRTIHYKPISGRLNGKMVHGVQYFYTDFLKADVTLTQFYVMQAVYELYGKNPFWQQDSVYAMFDKVCGSSTIRETFRRTMKVSDIRQFWTKDVEAFRRLASKYYLYL